MPKILGIDPGSHVTGWGLIDAAGSQARSLGYGTLRLGDDELPDRLLAIHGHVRTLLGEHRPEVVAVETAFYHKSVHSVLVLGHVRGVILLAAREASLPIVEVSPRQTKQSVTGNGNATKEQVSFMVQRILGLTEAPPADASDALAVALCAWHRARIPVAAR